MFIRKAELIAILIEICYNAMMQSSLPILLDTDNSTDIVLITCLEDYFITSHAIVQLTFQILHFLYIRTSDNSNLNFPFLSQKRRWHILYQPKIWQYLFFSCFVWICLYFWNKTLVKYSKPQKVLHSHPRMDTIALWGDVLLLVSIYCVD